MARDSRVVVITGASSGIDRATALAFAGRGFTAVVGARRADPLEDVARECRRLAGEGLAVPTDVTDEAAVRALAGERAASLLFSMPHVEDRAVPPVAGSVMQLMGEGLGESGRWRTTGGTVASRPALGAAGLVSAMLAWRWTANGASRRAA